jgi:hypothetical protein
LGRRGIVEEKSDDEERHYYIAVLNTVRANQEISSITEVITKIIFISQSKTLRISANHKKDDSYLSRQSDQSKYNLTIFMEAI